MTNLIQRIPTDSTRNVSIFEALNNFQNCSYFLPVNFVAPKGVPLGYEEMVGNCRGHTLSTGLSIPIDECAEKCNETFNCAGFSFSVTTELCYLKAAWCETPKMDSTYKFYKKEITDERFEVPGYLKIKGNCKGNILGSRVFGELPDCAFRCTSNLQCVGFSFSKDESTCFLKSALCQLPSTQGNYNFYEKLGPNKTSSSVGTPNAFEGIDENELPESVITNGVSVPDQPLLQISQVPQPSVINRVVSVPKTANVNPRFCKLFFNK